MLKELLEKLIRPIVDFPDDVQVTEVEGQSVCIFELRVNPGDFGKVIGKHGKNANSIRIILNAVAAKSGKRAVLEIIE